MTSITLILRLSAMGPHHPGSLCLRLVHARRSKTITLKGCRIYKSEWNAHTRQIIYPVCAPARSAWLQGVEKRVNNELEIIQGLIAQLQQRGFYTVDQLAALYRQKKADGHLLGFTTTLAREMEREGRLRTARAYLTVVRGLVRFYGGEDLPLHEINSSLIRTFEKHLKDTGRLPNTIAYYMRNLRAIYNKAVSGRMFVPGRGEHPFAGISTAVTKTRKRALKLEELQRLYKLASPRYTAHTAGSAGERIGFYRSWQYFFFSFFARGMSFVDLAYLRKENIRGGMIRYCRKKTGQYIEISIHGELQQIIDSFAGEVVGSPYVFPIIRSRGKKARLEYESALRSHNNHLKKLAFLADIHRPVSSHVARHSWATAGKILNVPVPVISDGLGHTTQGTTAIYLALLENRVLDDANNLIARAVRGSEFRQASYKF